jgi:serine beta-lactamase-like protein LACTB
MQVSAGTRFCVALLLAGISASALAAPGDGRARTATAGLSPRIVALIDRAVESEMQRQQLVGVAVGVIKGGRLVLTKGYGLADREKLLPVTRDTVFNWASNTKPMAAVLAMQLVDKKRLQLDADVRKYVPEFEATDGVITTRLLLCHESGLPHWNVGKAVPDDEFDPKAPVSLDPLVNLHRFNRSPLLFKPGERFSYSSYGYILLSAVLTRAGGEPFEAQIRKRIAEPLHLESLQLDVATNGQPDWTVGYTKKGGAVVRAREIAHAWKLGAGAYKSNIDDFAKWAAALINHKVVSKNAEQQMWTPQTTTNGQPTSWGLGFAVNKKRTVVSHSGEHEEGTSNMVLNVHTRNGIVLLCNCGFADAGALAKAIESAMDRRTN